MKPQYNKLTDHGWLEVKKAQLSVKIQLLKEESDAIPCTMEEAREAKTILGELVSQIIEGKLDKDFWMNADKGLFEKARKIDLLEEADDYEETLKKPLAYVSTKYLLIDGDLIKPAGFSPSDMIFVQTPIFIQLNRLPGSWSDNLKAFDMNQIRKENGVATI